MSYLRADDSLDANPKILALGNDQRRYTWVRILLYSIRFASPEIPPNISETVPKATRTFLRLCADIGLIDTDENTGTMRVHDWDEYNGIVAEQREKWKESKRTQRGQPRDKPQDRPRTDQGQPEDETTDSRVGARSRVPFPFPLKQALKAEQYSVREGAALPLAKDFNPDTDDADRSDPVIRLLLVLRDRDERTEAVLRSFAARLPEAAFDYTRDELARTGGGAGKAVAILKRIEREGTLGSLGHRDDTSDDESPPSGTERPTQNGSGSGLAYIAGLIRNGGLSSLEDLQVELDLAGLEGDDRAVLVAELERARFMEVVE